MNNQQEEHERLRNFLYKAFFMAAAAFLLCIILLLLVITVRGPETRPPRRDEAMQLLNSARDFLRVEYSKHGYAEETREPFTKAIKSGEFTGEYFCISPEIELSTNQATIHSSPTERGSVEDGSCYMTFEWASGSSTIDWKP
ncbi:MAG: hypothetical protein KDB90_16505 [Planctomycetes bacterium]|nr:hypothetical protein [Planctomycetota bacterium]